MEENLVAGFGLLTLGICVEEKGNVGEGRAKGEVIVEGHKVRSWWET